MRRTPSRTSELGDEDAKKLTEIQRDLAHAELVLVCGCVRNWAALRRLTCFFYLTSERQAQATLKPVYEKRRDVVKAIPNFWPVALMRHSLFNYHAQHNADQTALSYLEDLWVEKDPNEHRCFTIEFVCALPVPQALE